MTDHKTADKIQAKYLVPDQTDYQEHFDHLVAYNRAIQEDLSAEVNDFFGQDLGYASLTITGSDARYEKCPASLIELIIAIDSSQKRDGIKEKLGEFLGKGKIKRFSDLEIKVASENKVCELDKNWPNEEAGRFVSPNRIFDATYISGHEPLVAQIKDTLIREVQEQGYGRWLYREIREKTKGYIKVNNAGRQKFGGQEKVHYDLDAEEPYVAYDPNNQILSFKQGPLRAVQFALVRDIMKAVREGTLEGKEALKLPTNTIEKIKYLQVRDHLAISQEEVSDLTDNYKFFLWFYNLSQTAYQKSGTTRLTINNADLIKERLDDVNRITVKNILRF